MDPGKHKKPHPKQPSVRELAAGLEGDPAAGRPPGAHTIFFTLSRIHMYNLVCGQELAPGRLGSEQEETGHQPTTATTPPPPHSVEVNALFRISCISFVSPCLSSGFCTVLRKLNPLYVFLTTPTTQGSRRMTEGNAGHAAADGTGVQTRLCTIRQRYATQCQWRNHRRRPTPPACGCEMPVVVAIVCNVPLCVLLQISSKP